VGIVRRTLALNNKCCFLPAGLPAGAACRYFVYSLIPKIGFSPHNVTRCANKRKFQVGPLSVPNLTFISAEMWDDDDDDDDDSVAVAGLV